MIESKLEKVEGNLATIAVTIPPDQIATALAAAYKKVVQKVNLPGFRKGQVPRAVLEAQFGKAVLYEEALEIMVPQAYLEALSQCQLEPIAPPKFAVQGSLEPEQPFKFTATVEVLPQVKLGKYQGLQVEQVEPTVGEAQVAERLQLLQERHAELVLSERTELAQGDFAVIDFSGLRNGQPFDGGTAQAYTLEIGSGQFIPGFEEQLIGMALGSERELQLTFPQEYPSPELAGQPVTFKVTLKEIKVREIPQLDDEFAKSLGKFETLADLKADLQKNLQQAAEVESKNNYAQAVIAQAVENAQVDLPETLIKQEQEELLHHFEHNLSQQGLGMEQFLEYSKKTKEQVAEEFRPEASRRVKTDLVLQAIARAEKLELSEAQLDQKLKELAIRYQYKDPLKFRRDLEGDGRLESLRRALLMEQAAELVRSSAVPKIVTSTPKRKGGSKG